ncbi:hypothetical protein KC332_g15253 [Hortaea werneckii]|uniref:Uncharacterized protein n=2 Tax=Hortaea werneckii TaxID=91943 RepID=A0A3M7HKP9_HORWE|nr:hypothetical protein KC358_g15272 [Hortaea werneckii]OTA31710.1 hypothetical protein BTJ68_07797 [Hortaea werneckii EXF-2000]KAI6804236.1 hypothetical protein KC350_g15013 [Hortaea werneckii]KAI6904759.1 hypothetical protein KC348_g15203 [Hortaea werneckii]KAI6922862.1 hypothetical protein KC341_g15124 [Hortaea werneckii]
MSSSSTFSSTSYSYSSSSSSSGGQTTGHRVAEQTYTDPSGTTVNQAAQNLGQPMVQETKHYDAQGNQMLEGAGAGRIGGSAGAMPERRIEDVSDDQAARDRAYEERMEDEYAKREGGA